MPNDKELIPKAVSITTNSKAYASVQEAAARALKERSGATWPHSGCAANLSALLQAAGIGVPMILGAGAIANKLGGAFNSRGWVHVPVGAQESGDVGITFDLGAPRGADHTYFVVARVDSNEMVIADNQADSPHTRFANGKAAARARRTTPTDYFLRAPNEQISSLSGGVSLPTIGAWERIGSANLMAATPTLRPTSNQLNSILQLSAKSEIARYDWIQRGQAPLGYTKGMAVTYARLLCKLRLGDPTAIEASRKYGRDGAADALTHYADVFEAADIPGDTSENRLRQLFVLLMGLGMRESSGRWCEGRDRAANNVTEETAEAGLFQTSWNARRGSKAMPQIFEDYTGHTDFLDIFGEEVTARDRDLENFGTGTGYEFQDLTKHCPAFAVEFAAVGLRSIRTHWGPLKRREAEVKRKADALFRQVSQLVDSQNLCPI